MADRKITGAVGLAGTVYRAGQEDALAAAADEAGVDLTGERFEDALAGDWAGSATGTVANEGDLPDDYPGREHLVEAGYTTREQVDALDRDALIALDGIGAATADKIIATRG